MVLMGHSGHFWRADTDPGHEHMEQSLLPAQLCVPHMEETQPNGTARERPGRTHQEEPHSASGLVRKCPLQAPICMERDALGSPYRLRSYRPQPCKCKRLMTAACSTPPTRLPPLTRCECCWPGWPQLRRAALPHNTAPVPNVTAGGTVNEADRTKQYSVCKQEERREKEKHEIGPTNREVLRGVGESECREAGSTASRLEHSPDLCWHAASTAVASLLAASATCCCEWCRYC